MGPGGRRETARQRIDAIHTRIGELQATRHDAASPAAIGEWIASAQRHLAAAQAAAERALAASVCAFRRAAKAHEHAAIQHERAARPGTCRRPRLGRPCGRPAGNRSLLLPLGRQLDLAGNGAEAPPPDLLEVGGRAKCTHR